MAAGPLAGVYGVFILIGYKPAAGILAARAGPYGHKINPGKFSPGFLFADFS
jgi:hypothetical protein